MIKLIVRSAFAAALLAAPAAFADTAAPAASGQTAKGPALVDAKGMALYTFDKDKDGKSACNGPCAHFWPPFSAAAGASAAGDWTVITREDGSTQWAYKGHPLYVYSKDGKPGDANGDGFKDVWHLAKP